jgi:hypothetical protein
LDAIENLGDTTVRVHPREAEGSLLSQRARREAVGDETEILEVDDVVIAAGQFAPQVVTRDLQLAKSRVPVHVDEL